MSGKAISGFCSIGLHEGLRPKNVWGTPLKVCVVLGHDGGIRCNCKCHKDIDEMYEAAGAPRIPQQNPDWNPPPRQDLSYVWDRPLVSAGVDAATVAYEPGAAPTDGGIVLESPRYTDAQPTASGTRRRGQLEEEVQRVCVGYLKGEFTADDEGYMTTKHIAHLVSEDDPPSPGAVHAVLIRWEKIGYATLNRDPLEFALLTPEGMKHGLQVLKNKAKASRKVRRV